MDNTTPPNDPYNPQQQGYNQQADLDAMEDMVTKTRNTAAISGGGAKVIIFGVIMVAFVGFMLNSMFGGTPKKGNVDVTAGLDAKGDASAVADTDNLPIAGGSAAIAPPPKMSLPAPPAPDNFTRPPVANDSALSDIPPLPSLENLSETVDNSDLLPPPPPIAPPVPDLSGLNRGGLSTETDEKTAARMRSNMLIMDNGGSAPQNNDAIDADQSLDQADSNRAFSNNALRAASVTAKANATRLNNLNITIAQGKIINAVLETAINTDLPGTLRAIVSRDTYAEAGRNILIPKGARLIGTYNTGVLRGQKRVMIIWTRMIRPDGVDIQIGSAGVDNLGRAGIAGFVDNKYMEIFSAAILTTSLSIGAAVGVDELVGDKNSTTTSNTDGSSTTNASPGAIAAANAVNDLSEISKSVVGNLIDMRPTITIDQGTRVNIFVNRDLTFPSMADDSSFVQ